MVMIIIPNFKN